jgi:hypothetical protein
MDATSSRSSSSVTPCKLLARPARTPHLLRGSSATCGRVPSPRVRRRTRVISRTIFKLSSLVQIATSRILPQTARLSRLLASKLKPIPLVARSRRSLTATETIPTSVIRCGTTVNWRSNAAPPLVPLMTGATSSTPSSSANTTPPPFNTVLCTRFAGQRPMPPILASTEATTILSPSQTATGELFTI